MYAMNIRPGYAVNKRRRTPRGFRVSGGTIVALVVFGMFLGYIIGLWHQIAQHQQRIKDENILVVNNQ